MSGPEEQLARNRLRASHADREQVIGRLKAAFVHGRLTKEEFDGRVDRAFAARTYAELTRLTDDLPVLPATPGPHHAPVRACPRPLADKDVREGGRAIANTVVITVLLWAAAIVTFNGALFIAAFGATCTVLAISAMTGSRLLGLWLDRLR
ncbi:MAG TPA: DUF1707 domain-containing protein [Streptosporangiaceae bacterium]|nr:DUF1707 domain-containing protein [Streptosporangiaceae bacterium]